MAFKTILSLLVLVCMEIAIHKETRNQDRIQLHAVALDDPICIVDCMQDGDRLTVTAHTVGCFVNASERLQFQKQGMEFIYVPSGSGADSKPDVVSMNAEQLTALRTFQEELPALGYPSCTTTVDFTLNWEGKDFRYTDGTCTWGGFYELKKSLRV